MSDDLQPSEMKVVAMVKLTLNRGRLKVSPGTVLVLGPDDEKEGVHIQHLLRNRAVVPYESEEQAAVIAAEWAKRKHEREHMRFGGGG